jgi:hypothetical protein
LNGELGFIVRQEDQELRFALANYPHQQRYVEAQSAANGIDGCS